MLPSSTFTNAITRTVCLSGAAGGSGFNQIRLACTKALLGVMQKGPWHPTLLSSYTIQPGGERSAGCMDNSEQMHRDVLRGLYRQGVLRLNEPGSQPHSLADRLRARLGLRLPPLDLVTETQPTPERIAQVCSSHATCVLTLAHLLPPGQGGLQYASHHAVLPFGTLRVAGEWWVVALDGNDLQNNRIMKAFEDYANTHLAGRCELITEGHMGAIQAMLEDKDLDVQQIVYTLINIDKAVRTADMAQADWHAYQQNPSGTAEPPPITQPNSITYAKNAEVSLGPMSPEMTAELTRLILGSARDGAYLKLPQV